MKNRIIISTLLISLSIMSCGESEIDETKYTDLAGVYMGTLNSSTSINEAATAEISLLSQDQILFHCYSDNFDSTVVLNLYKHYDTVNVCLTGEEFEREYGHSMGQHHMMHGSDSFETSWQHHLSDEHNQGDLHYGYYHSNSEKFHFTFRMENGNQNYDLIFEGTKQ